MTNRSLQVALALLVYSGQALFVRRLDPEIPEYDRHWELPGGKLEPGENARTAASRELFEEAGYWADCVEEAPFEYRADLSLKSPPLTVNVTCWRCELASTERSFDWPNIPPPTAVGSHEYAWLDLESLPRDQIIPGSREFALWGASASGVKTQAQGSLYTLQLESVDPDKNRYWLYQATLSYRPDAKESPFLVTTMHGRAQECLTDSKSYSFKDYRSALNELKHRANMRRRHGYKLVGAEPNHPLRSWLEASQLGRSEPTYPTLFDGGLYTSTNIKAE